MLFSHFRARLRYHRSLKPLPGVGCSAGSSPDAIRPNSRFASVRAISGVQGDPRLLVVSLRTGRFFAERKWLAETAPVGWGKRIRTHKCRFQNWPLKCGPNFPSFRNVWRSETLSRLSCQRVTCTPVQSISAMNMARRSPLRRGQAMLERRLLWIREFESSHPSQCGLSGVLP